MTSTFDYASAEKRAFRVKRSISEMGRSAICFDCPFCAVEVKGFLWSLAGSGKRCSCGAMHKMDVSYKVNSEETRGAKLMKKQRST